MQSKLETALAYFKNLKGVATRVHAVYALLLLGLGKCLHFVTNSGINTVV